MNYIIKSGKNLAAVSNTVKAENHKHWMLQMFLGCRGNLDINVAGEEISCKCIVVDMATRHEFKTGEKVHFTILIEPTTETARQIRMNFLGNKPYFILPDEWADQLQRQMNGILKVIDKDKLLGFIDQIYKIFHTDKSLPDFDVRISELLKIFEACEFGQENYNLKYFSDKLSLSPSRLAHLFKEQTGIPLKSYMVLSKLLRAYAVLLKGGNITEAAMASGFDTPAHLARTNKDMTGMSASGILKDSEFLKVFS